MSKADQLEEVAQLADVQVEGERGTRGAYDVGRHEEVEPDRDPRLKDAELSGAAGHEEREVHDRERGDRGPCERARGRVGGAHRRLRLDGPVAR